MRQVSPAPSHPPSFQARQSGASRAGKEAEQFGGHVWRRAQFSGTEIEPAWIGLCHRDHVGCRTRRNRRVHHQDEGRAAGHGSPGKILRRIKLTFPVQLGRDGQCRLAAHHQGVAVRWRLRGGFGRDQTARPERFSTTTDWPIVSVIFCARIRATTSVPPPAENPTSILIGLSGKLVVCAAA
jgi:hypothetical protein